MTGVELVLAALAAGAAGGITEATSSSIRDGYAALRDLLRRKLSSQGGEAAEVLEAHESAPGVFEARMREYVMSSGADQDEAILEAARRVLVLLDPSGNEQGKYTVDARNAKGVQIGPHNTQTNTFS
ncbi:hypothetical protein M2163_001167 [Streptomyces sp. SAI-135]|jgi:hypothetical protein|uniref:RIP homotypic interaction motif-containing protein n=1 Tax=unclassified Streptomyces TaxID=2593676 RepID=UPI0024753357|nr:MULTISPECIES: RIP homotypic interaction motif-containing protein [unclassified Streptomyces]MDH6521840.1 hypothetical protein [Streptomyces sp. SAI-090]MDH6573206.1 hypothetical protein [Streptomyces sp. SAI-117]MDH6614059.1 hypothetical protein [Streptomyces sp. SAI-135]